MYTEENNKNEDVKVGVLGDRLTNRSCYKSAGIGGEY